MRQFVVSLLVLCALCANAFSADQQEPIIQSISGPAVVWQGQKAAWKISAVVPQDATVQWSVEWNDTPDAQKGVAAPNVAARGIEDAKSVAEFSHSYRNVGLHNVTVTVYNIAAATSAEVSVSVLVLAPKPIQEVVVMAPSGGDYLIGDRMTISFQPRGFTDTDVLYARVVRIKDEALVHTAFFTNAVGNQTWSPILQNVEIGSVYYIRFDLRVLIKGGDEFKPVGKSLPFLVIGQGKGVAGEGPETPEGLLTLQQAQAMAQQAVDEYVSGHALDYEGCVILKPDLSLKKSRTTQWKVLKSPFGLTKAKGLVSQNSASFRLTK